jgi:DNA polymerase III subunit delta
MILFLYGPDTYRSSQKLKEIKTQYEKAHQGTARAFDFDCKEVRLEDVQSAIGTISLFEQKKLVILRNVFQAVLFEQWLEDEKKALVDSNRHVVVVFEDGDVQKKTGRKLFQWLKKHATTQEFLLLSLAKLKLWIEREFGRYGFSIAARGSDELARAIGNDLWRMGAEIRKIAAWKQSTEGKTVKEADVKLLVLPKVETDIFATIDAAAQKNKKQACSLLYRHVQKGDSPQYLLSMLVYQFRILVELRDFMEKGFSGQEIARQTKLHPYVLQKSTRVAGQFSIEELKHIYRKLFKLDWHLKTGRADPAGALDMFIATL